MDESEKSEPKILESPKPVAFTVDFGENRPLDTQKYQSLVEKYQQFKHRRNQSLSKIEDVPKQSTKKPLTGQLPRKGFSHEGYISSDEKSSSGRSEKGLQRGQNIQVLRSTVLNSAIRRELTLPLKSTNNDRMTQSFPARSFDLPTIDSPEIELKDISSPELDLISPLSPLISNTDIKSNKNATPSDDTSSCDENMVDKFKSCVEINDNVSEAGTYTIETDNYTEEQKQRMSIDQDYNIEQVSVQKKTQEYIQNLIIGSPVQEFRASNDINLQENHQTISVPARTNLNNSNKPTQKVLNLSQRSSAKVDYSPQDSSPEDRGVFTLVTASGVLNKQQKSVQSCSHNLVKSVVALETYPTNLNSNITSKNQQKASPKTTVRLFAQNISVIDHEYRPNSPTSSDKSDPKLYSNHSSPIHKITRKSDQILSRSGDSSPQSYSPSQKAKGGYNFRPRSGRESPKSYNFRPQSGQGSPGHDSPNFRPRSGGDSPNISPVSRRNNLKNYPQTGDLSDSSLDTESYLKPTQNIISSLQQRLSIDSDSDEKQKFMPLNNEAKSQIFKNKTLHVRHNSFDDRAVKLTNKLEHFHSKNLNIDQTLSNQYKLTNSPIRRSSSFSLKNQFDNLKYLNTQVKDSNTTKRTNQNIHRSSSTANIKPKVELTRRASINSEPQELRNNYIETDSSSEDDYDKNLSNQKPKKDLTTTRYNRAFSLRRARLDVEPQPQPKCPNTPEMKRKFADRTVSVDRKSSLSKSSNNEVQPRYMNITKAPPKSAPPKSEVNKNLMPKNLPKPQPSFSRTDSGRFSLRTPKPNSGNSKNVPKKDLQGKKQSGPRSNSTLSSREVEFQNWKRRKSYDPMKAAAEGKKKAELARKGIMTQSYNENNQEYDSSPSHSSSVHRSQSFHGTAALEQNLISSEDDELTLSGEDGFSPPIPSPSQHMSPIKNQIKAKLWKYRYTKN